MFVAILAGLLVSIDALFIGVSFGSQKRCKVWHIIVINIALIGLCFLGYFLGLFIGDRIYFDIDLIIGLIFILLGVWMILAYFIFEHRKRKREEDVVDETLATEVKKRKGSTKNIWLTGIFMSVEAMFITIGLTLTLEISTVLIPLTVAIAHFAYSLVTFFLSKYLRRFPPIIGHIVAGLALIAYGIMAIVL
ncbi:MAG: manganese efflux pump [Firmicutes bacterium]|nr:manganese efflux pump [Bacillota bacterium]MCL2255861.1 manganese efflux pump [Bacillota bacterium]MCL2256241.1 manganese efflux pump [Bacillota bacterium]